MTETQPEVVTMDDSDDDQPAAAAAAKPARSSRAVATQPKAAPKQAKPAAAGKSQKKAPKQAAAAAAPAVAAAAGAQFTAEELQLVRGRLLAWYDEHHRVLPWRRTPHSKRTLPAPSGPHEVAHPAPADLDAQAFAYRVWVSEVMLQQTQVSGAFTALGCSERALVYTPGPGGRGVVNLLCGTVASGGSCCCAPRS